MNSIMHRKETWAMAILLLIGISTALPDPKMPVLSASSLPPGDDELSHPAASLLLSLKTLATRALSFDGIGVELHWPKLELNWRLATAVVLGAMGASLCSAGGVGGGGLYIPLFNLLIGFDAKSAAALSNFMILGGSVANLGWNVLQEHPFLSGQPLIDFDVALLLQPNMLLGISIGVICNVVFPSWFIILEFVITLGYITKRSFRSGLCRWRNETRLLEEEPASFIDAQEKGQSLANGRSTSFDLRTGCVLEESDLASPEVLNRVNSRLSRQSLLNGPPSFNNKGGEATEPLLENLKPQSDFPYGKKLLILTSVWLVFFAVNILRGGKSAANILNLEPCGTTYWFLTMSQVPLAFLLTGWSAWHLNQETAKNSSPELQPEEWDLIGPRAFIIFPSMALLAGFLGGMLGIGGGMLINPLLIEIGMHPQLTAATTGFMVFFSSSLSVVQFWLLGRLPLDFALLFAGVCFLFSLGGICVVQQAISKFGRPSVIVFSVGTVLGVSAVLTAIFGGLDIWTQYTHGEYMGFHNPC